MIVYVLRLQDNRFYVGKSNNAKKSYQDHINGTACEWTKRYPPIIMEKIIPNAPDEMVEILLKEYVLKYGAHNVQGEASMNPFLLPSYPLVNIKTLSYVQNIMKKQEGMIGCYKCGRMGHKGWDCFANAYQ